MILVKSADPAQLIRRVPISGIRNIRYLVSSIHWENQISSKVIYCPNFRTFHKSKFGLYNRLNIVIEYDGYDR